MVAAFSNPSTRALLNQSLRSQNLMFPTSTPNQEFDQPLRRRRTRRRRRCRRDGAAAVEAAICFPLIILLMLGTLEISAGLYVKESLSVCCFEGCRIGTRRGATAGDVEARTIEVLASRNIVGATIEVIPDNFSGLSELDNISVRITAPTAGNSIFIFDNLANRSIQSQVTMIREFDD